MESWPTERTCSAFYSTAFFIKCVFLSHNVIWKQFLPTAGFAFTIGKHVKWKAGDDAERHRRSLSPTRLAHVLRLILGLCTSLIKTENVFKQATHTAFPPSGGQHVLWGRNFLNTLQIKLIRCRPDCQPPRSWSSMWRPTEHRLPQVPTVLVPSGLPGPTRSLSEGMAFPAPLPPEPIQDQSPENTDLVIKEDEYSLRSQFSHRHRQKAARTPEGQENSCHLGVGSHPLHSGSRVSGGCFSRGSQTQFWSKGFRA